MLPDQTNPIIFCDSMPMMADVVSGRISQPRERRKRESLRGWLEQTPAWARIWEQYAPARVTELPELKIPARVGLTPRYVHFFALHISESYLLAVNEDGTSYALATPFQLLAEAWASLDRSSAGRPPIETENPKTLAQRKWRAKKKES